MGPSHITTSPLVKQSCTFSDLIKVLRRTCTCILALTLQANWNGMPPLTSLQTRVASHEHVTLRSLLENSNLQLVLHPHLILHTILSNF
jgi:hypothetical protein